jgi:regulator of replication initiation timing
MPIQSDIHITRPEDRELEAKRSELAALEANLAERELQLASLRAELSSFERKYLAEVGSRYAELDELKAKLAERLAAENPGDLRLQEAARQARARADETRATAVEDAAGEHKIFSPTPELKRLYRDVAKRIHPDLTSNDADRAKRQELMAQANRAYEMGDEAALARVFAAYECSPESVSGEGTPAELVRTIRRISQARYRLSEIEAESQKLLHSDSHQLRTRFDEAARQGNDLFAALAAQIAYEIARMKQKLAHRPVPSSVV